MLERCSALPGVVHVRPGDLGQPADGALELLLRLGRVNADVLFERFLLRWISTLAEGLKYQTNVVLLWCSDFHYFGLAVGVLALCRMRVPSVRAIWKKSQLGEVPAR